MPSILIGLAIAAICAAIIARGIHNKRRGRGGCSCGGSCGSCGCSGLCHPESRSDSTP
ncbi:FeoB-associated Cys-rich membrane protein [Flavonifractor sp. HCP28S3_F3]|uniref:FeoB-associated Cys-rich membrane protein n=1 Tax=Flavonifractor sp. HCP28S3_F3 TaxID=3438939 RepID=UPI003F8AD34F